MRTRARQRAAAEEDLRPARWPPHWLRRATMLRLAAVGALLAVAAAILWSAEPVSPCAPVTASTDGPSPSVSPSATLTLPAGTVGVPVRLADPAALTAVRPGARVDLLAVPPAGVQKPGGEPLLLAGRALVLDVLTGDAGEIGSALYLALKPAQAQATIAQPEGSRFAIVVRE
ncbi:flagellar biosynthesis protein FlgA [Micromonosporaceae bacterium DT55]|uniref:flagellar biosynthesis protein FlgA n=1 Tax=Melissospora conviva TaxID=3388432 RepID=UPI003C217FFA